jgi:hypothetical protein
LSEFLPLLCTGHWSWATCASTKPRSSRSPKKSFLSEYSPRITPQKVERLLALWHAQVGGDVFTGGLRGMFDSTSELRLANGHDVLGPGGPFTHLVAKIRAARWSKARMELLMTLPLLPPRRH